ncbi:MAG TPA: class I SAM-dependent methyltransferase [Anaeromyxobacteraceae bacterium]|nr:class I SAM-dependent methyltransferase [Anaeromyxobacteraceae bacterium]
MIPHWTDAYYGDLYLDSVADLLTPRLSALEAEAIATLLRLAPHDRVLDLACGHGRHARVLAGRVGWICGVDRSADYLRRATSTPAPTPTYLRADLRALPFRPASFDAAYSWYSSLFMFDDPTNLAALAEAARVVRPGGRLLVHHANPLRLAREPEDAARRTLPDGGAVEETSTFDPATGVDRCARRLTRRSGAVLEGTAELRYYTPAEWRTLSRAAGLRVVRLTTTPLAGQPGGGEIGPEAPDLVAVLEKTP